MKEEEEKKMTTYEMLTAFCIHTKDAVTDAKYWADLNGVENKLSYFGYDIGRYLWTREDGEKFSKWHKRHVQMYVKRETYDGEMAPAIRLVADKDPVKTFGLSEELIKKARAIKAKREV